MTININNGSNNSCPYKKRGRLYWYAIKAKGWAYCAAAKVIMAASSVLGMIALGVAKLVGLEGC